MIQKHRWTKWSTQTTSETVGNRKQIKKNGRKCRPIVGVKGKYYCAVCQNALYDLELQSCNFKHALFHLRVCPRTWTLKIIPLRWERLKILCTQMLFIYNLKYWILLVESTCPSLTKRKKKKKKEYLLKIRPPQLFYSRKIWALKQYVERDD